MREIMALVLSYEKNMAHKDWYVFKFLTNMTMATLNKWRIVWQVGYQMVYRWSSEWEKLWVY